MLARMPRKSSHQTQTTAAQPQHANKQADAHTAPAWTTSLGSRPAPSLTLQTKLTVNQPGDAHEREADRVAAQVMTMPNPRVQRRCACGGETGPDGECAACKARRLALQRQMVEDDEEEKPVQRRESSTTPTPTHAPPSVHQAINSSGQPLNTNTRDFMESRFGQDFSGVRVHTDSQAAQSAADVSAQAYTVGQNVVFGAGRYAPGTSSGDTLIAHELMHVVQQGVQPARLQRQPTIRRTQPQCPTRQPGEAARSRSTPMHAAIDQSASQFTVVISNFAVNEAGIKSDLSRDPVWTNMLRTMDTTATGTWEVLGYTDCQGTEGLNQALRQERAVSMAALLPSGARARVMTIAADSMTNYLASNATEAERSRNRAVIIRRLPGSTGPTPPGAPSAPIGPVKPPGTPADFCVPFPTGIIGDIEAAENRRILYTHYLPGAAAMFGTTVAGLWLDYWNRPKGASLTPRVFRGSGDIVDAFRHDPATAAAVARLTREIRTAARTIPEANVPFTGPSYTSPALGLGTLLPVASLEPLISYGSPATRIPGNIAGGASGRGVDASDAGPDLRLFTGSVQIERTRVGGRITKTAHVTLQLQVIDAIDFCPGNPGGLVAQLFTIPMSRLEATPRLTTYDLPFHVFVDYTFAVTL